MSQSLKRFYWNTLKIWSTRSCRIFP